MTPKKLFIFFAISEALTWSLLIGVLILRIFFDVSPGLVTAIGGTHGAIFLGYGTTAALVGVNQRWRIRRIILGIALAIVPYATIPFERSTVQKRLVEGDWRKTKTSDPRDNQWFDRLFRWFIARPAFLIVVLLATVTAIFATLVSLGPPTDWGN
jgi:integral membrane protein